MIQTLLVDTDVVSWLFKQPAAVEHYRSVIEGRRLAVSFMTVAELFKWVVKREWGELKKARLEATLQAYLILPYDRELAWAWARIMATCENEGFPISTSDGWIAATALRHSLPLLTHNVRHFEPIVRLCGLQLIRSPG